MHSDGTTAYSNLIDQPSAVSSDISEQAPAATTSRSTRYEFLDFLKGFLVLGMVIFHALNYFAVNYDMLVTYLRFVSGGFLFLTGYLLFPVYAAKWKTSPGKVTGRLTYRGVKLILLFTAINATIALLAVKNFNTVQFGLAQFFQDSKAIYLHGTGRRAAFEILLPIGYFLVLSPLILLLVRNRIGAIILLVLGLMASAFLPLKLNNWSMLLVGICGFCAGAIFSPEDAQNRKHALASVPALLIAIIAMPYLKMSLLGYIAYVTIVLKAAADLGAYVGGSNIIKKVVIDWGRNVLFCYLLHIAILQGLFRVFWPDRNSGLLVTGMMIAATYVILGTILFILGRLRQKFVILDNLYKVVFT